MMALFHTSEELINRTAALLGKFVPGEALGAIEHDTIDRCIDDVLAEMSKIVVVDKEQVPNLYFETAARLCAIYAAADFSNQPLDLGAIAQHERRLYYLVSQTPTYEVLRTEYF
jgi:hypothetical protein